MKQYDIVYPIGSGSAWNDSELRYSLRAIVKNLTGYRHIVIVGRLPDFIDKKQVIHIAADDPLPSNADGNIALKVLKACNHKRVSDDFLFINDDHIINKPMNVSDIGFYHKGDMAEYPAGFWHQGLHRQRLKRTFEVLKQKGHTTFHFDIHTPIRINKKLFTEIVPTFNFKSDIGYTMKSIYANAAVPDEQKENVGGLKTKLFKHKSLAILQETFSRAHYVSYNDFGLNGALKYHLALTFPQISKYELYDKEKEPSVIIREYLDTEPDNYTKGVELFSKYSKNATLKALFNRKCTNKTKEKLLYKLEVLADDYN